MAKRTQTYSELMAELQTVLADLQAEELDVDEAIGKFERGQILIGALESYLQAARNKVEHHRITDIAETD